MIKKISALILCLVFFLPATVSCKDKGPSQLLSFAQTANISNLTELNNTQVSIIGYMSTLSPVDGSFMYLMNMPYQSCPFCIPNSDNQLSNTIAVYAKSGDEFEFTDRAIKVTGTLQIGNYSDYYGYKYSFRIADATYEILDTSDMDESSKLWQSLASTDVISDIYAMYDYVNFLCLWATYSVDWSSGKDYIHAADVMNFLHSEDYTAQFAYAYDKGDKYFDDIIATVKTVDETAFTDLIANIEDAKALANEALSEFNAGNYSITDEYSGKFNDGRKQYKLNNQKSFQTRTDALWSFFSNWLGSWEI
ncbi:MAG: hypothetical protein IJZ93_04925 [Clostridia bacterium]|nr:hypothetical protein [Clostridia bacterium]